MSKPRLASLLWEAAALALVLPLIGTLLLALISPAFAIPIAMGGIISLAFAEIAGFVPSLATVVVFRLTKDRFGPLVTFLTTELVAAISCAAWWTLALGQSVSSFEGPSFLLLLAAIAALATLVITLPDLLWRRQKGEEPESAQLKA